MICIKRSCVDLVLRWESKNVYIWKWSLAEPILIYKNLLTHLNLRCFSPFMSPVSTDHMKGNRQNKIDTPQDLSQRMMSMGNLKRSMSTMSAIERSRMMKSSLLAQLEVLSPYLPPNTLDELIDELGGPENVAEV